MTIAAAILAAGASRRLGQPKQLLPFRGTTLLRAIALEVCASTCDHVVVVLGAHAGRIVPTLTELPVALEANVLWSEGMASSIRCAVAWALRASAGALVLLACDQPALTTAHVDALVAMFRRTNRPTASRYAGVTGLPAVFGAPAFPELSTLRGDIGARHVLAAAQPATVEWPDGEHDIDTPGDVAVAR